MDADAPPWEPVPVPEARPASRRTLVQLAVAAAVAGALATASALMAPASTAIFDRPAAARDLTQPGDFTSYGAQPASVRWLGQAGSSTVWAYLNVSDFVCVLVVEDYPDGVTGSCVPPGVFARTGIDVAAGTDPATLVRVRWGPRGDAVIGTAAASAEP